MSKEMKADAGIIFRRFQFNPGGLWKQCWKPQNKSPGLGGNRDFTKRKLPFILSNVSATTSSLKESEAPTLSRPFCMVLI
ncbi:uncharacterized protein LOC143669956 isoform X3 [Tamandua tetradactyla]|uniref:uncharacterized protein LOC143669956 isoform X3 n=1 Tax=Tamandua tetradactyla TaxID=48850 RepID=UPI0040541C16